MNRRGFFGLFAAAAAATAIAVPELELLVPTRTIFLPPAGGWIGRGNQLVSVELLSREILYIFEQKLEFMARVNREYDPAFTAGNRTATINIRKPPRYDLRVGDKITIEGVKWPS